MPSEAKFTPGPWVARDGAIYSGERGNMLLGDCIGEQWRCKARISSGAEMEANAELMASAPSMHSAGWRLWRAVSQAEDLIGLCQQIPGLGDAMNEWKTVAEQATRSPHEDVK